MEIEDIIILILTNSAITAVLLAAIGFISKSLIEQWLNKKLERYKVEVQTTLKYNEKKLEVIDHLYRSLINYSKIMNAITSELVDYKAKGYSLESNDISGFLDDLELKFGCKNSFEVGIEIWDFYEENCLYLSEDLSHKVQDLLLKAFVIQTFLTSMTDFESTDISSIRLKDLLLIMKKTDQVEMARKLQSDFTMTLGSLLIEFRKQLVD